MWSEWTFPDPNGGFEKDAPVGSAMNWSSDYVAVRETDAPDGARRYRFYKKSPFRKE